MAPVLNCTSGYVYLHGRGVLMSLLKLTRGFHYSALSFLVSDYPTIDLKILFHSDSEKFSTHFPPLRTQLLTRCPNTSQRFRGQDSLSLASPRRYFSTRGYSQFPFQLFLLISTACPFYVHHFFSLRSYFLTVFITQKFLLYKSYLSFSHAYDVVTVERNSYFLPEICIRTEHLIRLYRQILIRH